MFTPASKEDAHSIHSAIFLALHETSIYQTAKKQGGKFHVAVMIALNGMSERVRFEYEHDGNGNAVRCRLEMNPSKLGAEGLAKLHAALMVLPNGWTYVIDHGRITRIDFAVDLPGLQMHQFLFMPHQGLTTKTWSQNGVLETLQLGNPKGNHTVVYSKDKEQLAKGKAYCGPSIVRVERRLRYPHVKLLKNVHQFPNPFASMVKTVQVPSPPPGEKANRWAMFLDSVSVRGLAAASGHWWILARNGSAAFDPGCVKTHTSEKCR